MQFFYDVTLVSIIAGALFLLLLLIICFCILSSRIKKQKSALARMQGIIDIQNKQLDSLLNDIKVNRTINHNLDKTVNFLKQNIDDLIEQQEKFKENFQNIDQKQTLQNKLIEQSVPENQAINDAIRLIRMGNSIDEVHRQTHVSYNELEVLFSLHSKVSSPDSIHQDPNESISHDSNIHESKIANMQARSAYGMSATPTLRRGR